MQENNTIVGAPSQDRLGRQVRPAWTCQLDTSLREQAFKIVQLIAERLCDPASVAEHALRQIKSRQSFFWGGASFNNLGSLALLYLFLARCFPKEGWQVIARQYLHLAAQRSQQTPLVESGLYAGSSGLALVVTIFCAEEPRYQHALDILNEQICQQVLGRPLPVTPTRILSSNYDVISGAAGTLGYLISLHSPTPQVQEAISALVHYLVWLCSEEKPGCPNWFIAPEWMTEHERALYPEGNYNLGLAHGLPGPLTALALAWQAGYRLPGQRDAIERISHWLCDVAITDDWGINWPHALPKGYTSSSKLLVPSRAGWCYGAPGISSALWQAGEAIGDEKLGQIAIESLESVCQRPIEARGIPSPTLCHGVGGLLAICLRLAQVSHSQKLHSQIPLLCTQILAACNSTYPLVVRDQDIQGNFVDDPSFLTGAVGVALVLLAASTDVEPLWDRVLMIA